MSHNAFNFLTNEDIYYILFILKHIVNNLLDFICIYIIYLAEKP